MRGKYQPSFQSTRFRINMSRINRYFRIFDAFLKKSRPISQKRSFKEPPAPILLLLQFSCRCLVWCARSPSHIYTRGCYDVRGFPGNMSLRHISLFFPSLSENLEPSPSSRQGFAWYLDLTFFTFSIVLDEIIYMKNTNASWWSGSPIEYLRFNPALPPFKSFRTSYLPCSVPSSYASTLPCVLY